MKKIKCSKCATKTRAGKARLWNVELKRGKIVAFLCPDCQTPEQDLEASVNEAMLNYSVRNGLIVGTPKGAGK